MTNPTQHGQVPEALRLAHIFDNPLPPEWPDMVAAAAELRRQHARIAELESQLAQRFDAADMATAAAQGFRDGVAPVSAVSEPVAWKHDCAALLANDVELWIDACPHCGKPRMHAHPSPPEGMAGWTTLPGQMPEPNTPVLLDIGKKFTIRALWAEKHTVRVGTDVDDWGEYDEETDEYYCPEGWYEWNEHEEVHWAVSETPRAWRELPQPLPAAPGPADGERAMGEKMVLDPCCGMRMMWFDKADQRTVFGDRRSETVVVTDNSRGNASGTRTLRIEPDTLMDFRALPFPDGRFKLVAFDPPHLEQAGPRSWLAAKYGKLGENWRDDLREGFAECWRVLASDGVLVFKWNETQVKVGEVLALAPAKPLFGQVSVRSGMTHWLVFMKPGGSHDPRHNPHQRRGNPAQGGEEASEGAMEMSKSIVEIRR